MSSQVLNFDRDKGICSPGSTLEKIFCPEHGLMGGATQQLAGETSRLLRFRLLIVSGFLFLGVLLFLILGIVTNDFVTPEQFLTLALLAGAAGFLYLNKNASTNTLRLIELFVFGSMVIHVSVYHLMRTLYITEEMASPLPENFIYRGALGFFFVIWLYGMFIPNHWIRAVKVAFSFLLFPVLVAAMLWFGHPAARKAIIGTLSPGDLLFVLTLLFLGTVVSVAGSHIIHNMRVASAQMREMGMYQIGDKIGEGGMGEVWKAEHRLLTRPAAIKMVRSDTLQTGTSESLDLVKSRFKREAQITASLRSPHTVELYDFGITNNGTFYYVMEYLDGVDLDHLVKKYGPQPAERVIFILRQAAESLAEAHRNGLVHRDIKPSNLHLNQMGLKYDFLKVLDFGLVKYQKGFEKDATKLTTEGVTTGTPAYMAPELALGRGEIDNRSDIYALGCVTYWLLTGQLVFEGESPMEIVIEHVKSPPVPPSERTELPIPKDLDEIVMACLEKDPEKRPQSLEHLIEQIDRLELENAWTQSRAAQWWETHRPQAAA